jgi:lysophospholipase L1-like esterase
MGESRQAKSACAAEFESRSSNMFTRLFVMALAACGFLTAHGQTPNPIPVWPLDPVPPGTPLAATAQPRIDWIHRVESNFQKYKDQPVDLIFDGDSITDFWQTDAIMNAPRGLPVWNERYVPLHAADFAISGDRVENVLWRVRNGELAGRSPKLIVLMIGTNNLNFGDVTDAQIGEGIGNLVAEYRMQCPQSHLLLLGVFPRGTKANDLMRAHVAAINQIISKLDDGKIVTYLDIGPKFLQPDGTFPTDIAPDGVHPTTKGYQIWADAIQPIVDQYCPKAAAASSPSPTPGTTGVLTNATGPAAWPTALPGGNPVLFPVPVFDRAFLYHYIGNLQKFGQGPFKLVFDGDSITDNWQGQHPSVYDYFGSYKLLDNAIAGDQTENVLWRVRHGDLKGQHPKLIMLLIGTNNIGQEPKDIAAGIQAILQEYETRCPEAHILLLGVFPRGQQPNTPTREWIKSINKIISTFDDGNRVTYLDIGDKFLQPDGSISPEIMPDFTHPTPKGYQIWADAVSPVIEKYAGPKP